MKIIELDGEVSSTHCTLLSPQGQVKHYMMYCSEGEEERERRGRERRGRGEGGGEVAE